MPEGTVESGLQKTEGICGRVCTQYVHGHRLELPGIVRLRESSQQRQHIRAGIFFKIAQTGDFYIQIIGTFQQLQYLRTPVGGGEANKIHQCSLHGVGAPEPIPQLPDERFSGLKMLQPLLPTPSGGWPVPPAGQGQTVPGGPAQGLRQHRGPAVHILHCKGRFAPPAAGKERKSADHWDKRRAPGIRPGARHSRCGHESLRGGSFSPAEPVPGRPVGAGSRLLLQLLHSLVKGQQPADSAEPVAQPRYLIAQLSL